MVIGLVERGGASVGNKKKLWEGHVRVEIQETTIIYRCSGWLPLQPRAKKKTTILRKTTFLQTLKPPVSAKPLFPSSSSIYPSSLITRNRMHSSSSSSSSSSSISSSLPWLLLLRSFLSIRADPLSLSSLHRYMIYKCLSASTSDVYTFQCLSCSFFFSLLSRCSFLFVSFHLFFLFSLL